MKGSLVECSWTTSELQIFWTWWQLQKGNKRKSDVKKKETEKKSEKARVMQQQAYGQLVHVW